MGSISLLGLTAAQALCWHALPGRSAFGLTAGSAPDATSIETSAVRDSDDYIWTAEALDRQRLHRGRAHHLGAGREGGIGGFVIEDPQHVEGVEICDLQGKIAKRGVLNAHITLRNVRVPAENRLAKTRSFADIGKVLTIGRVGVAWEAAGVAAGAFEHALTYARERKQFGRPIASFQLIQQKLAEMATEVTLMQLMCFQLSQLLGAGQITPGMASMAKYNNARKARYVAALARETMGGNGILIENHAGCSPCWAVYTYEGTNEVSFCWPGKTGIDALA